MVAQAAEADRERRLRESHEGHAAKEAEAMAALAQQASVIKQQYEEQAAAELSSAEERLRGMP